MTSGPTIQGSLHLHHVSSLPTLAICRSSSLGSVVCLGLAPWKWSVGTFSSQLGRSRRMDDLSGALTAVHASAICNAICICPWHTDCRTFGAVLDFHCGMYVFSGTWSVRWHMDRITSPCSPWERCASFVFVNLGGRY